MKNIAITLIIVLSSLVLASCCKAEEELLQNTESFTAQATINGLFDYSANYCVFGDHPARENSPGIGQIALSRVEGNFSYSPDFNPLAINFKESLGFILPSGSFERPACYELVNEAREGIAKKARLSQRSHDVFFETWHLIHSEPIAQVCITHVSRRGNIVEGTFNNIRMAYNEYSREHLQFFAAPEYTDTVLITNGTFKARRAVVY